MAETLERAQLLPPMTEHQLTDRDRAHLDAFTLARRETFDTFLAARWHDEVEASCIAVEWPGPGHGQEGDQPPTHRYGGVHWYTAELLYTLDRLREHLAANAAVSVLDLGSPITQNIAVSVLPQVARLTMVDIRPMPGADLLPFHVQQASATALPFDSASFDVVTSTCKLCHLGDGRYDEALSVDADLRALQEIARVLRPRGLLVLVPGPVLPQRGALFYNAHRAYTMGWLDRELARVGIRVLDQRAWSLARRAWVTVDQISAGWLADGAAYMDHGCLTGRRVI